MAEPELAAPPLCADGHTRAGASGRADWTTAPLARPRPAL